jgi:hypothetical protein
MRFKAPSSTLRVGCRLAYILGTVISSTDYCQGHVFATIKAAIYLGVLAFQSQFSIAYVLFAVTVILRGRVAVLASLQ